MNSENLPLARITIDELVRRRNEALRLYGEAYEALEVAHSAVSRANAVAMECSPGINNYNHSQAREITAFEAAGFLPDRESYLRTARRVLDLNCWAWVVQKTRLEALMDHEAKEELRKQMAYIPERVDRDSGRLINAAELEKGMPEISVANVVATLQMYQAQSAEIMARGIAKAFSKLDRRFRSHDGFKVGSRVILTGAFSEYSGGINHGRNYDMLIDIERAFTVLDGRIDGTFSTGIQAAEASRRGSYGPRQSEAECKYYRIKGFKNGNAHLWFTRDDLVEKVNRVLADYYGETLGDSNVSEPDPLKAPKTEVARYFGFYPTPTEAAAKVVELAQLYRGKGCADLRILEPSAGTGNLASLLAQPREQQGSWGRDAEKWIEKPAVDCIEIQPHLATALESSRLYRRVTCADFLSVPPNAAQLYDRVVMNPPFDRERDIDHVVHALGFLAPNGRLVSIMSAGTEFRETKKSIAFRQLIERMGGAFVDLPERSFASVGTNVNTIVCVVNKNGSKVGWIR